MKPTLIVAAILVLGGQSPSLGGQTPVSGGQTPSQQPGAPAGQRQGGGGRGRGPGPMQVMTLSTTAWLDGGLIPIRYTQAGAEVSPPLTWSDPPVPPPPAPVPAAPAAAAPPSTTVKSFVLIAHDIDAPAADLSSDTLHWMVWNIPATSRGLPEHVPHGPERPDGSRQISATGPYYRGPAAPATGPPHHYVFDLYALDTIIDVPAVGATVPQTRAAVMAAMAGHVRGKATLVGRFKYAAAGLPAKK